MPRLRGGKIAEALAQALRGRVRQRGSFGGLQ
jgi:hypothetical protein